MLQNATRLRKSAPWPPNISDEHVSCTAPATRNASCQILCIVPRLPSFLKLPQNPHVLLTLDKVHNPLRLPRKTTSERLKILRTPQFFALLTSKCASRHNGVHLFDISASKSGPSMVCFVHFDLEMCFAPALFRHLNFRVVCFVNFDFDMCFAPQRRALFRHLNFQKWSDVGVFCTFWLRMCFAPQRPETVHLSSDHMAPHPPLSRAYFSTLRSHKSFEKRSVLRRSYLFAHLDFLSSETFSFWIFLLLFSYLTLPTCAFPSVHIVGSLTLNFLRLVVGIVWGTVPKFVLLHRQVFYTPSPEPDVLEVRKVDMAEWKVGRAMNAMTFMMFKNEFLSHACSCTEDLPLILCKLMQAALVIELVSRVVAESSSEAALVAVLQLHVSRPPGDVLVFLFGPCAPVTPATREFASFSFHRRKYIAICSEAWPRWHWQLAQALGRETGAMDLSLWDLSSSDVS